MKKLCFLFASLTGLCVSCDADELSEDFCNRIIDCASLAEFKYDSLSECTNSIDDYIYADDYCADSRHLLMECTLQLDSCEDFLAASTNPGAYCSLELEALRRCEMEGPPSYGDDDDDDDYWYGDDDDDDDWGGSDYEDGYYDGYDDGYGDGIGDGYDGGDDDGE